MTAEDLDSKAAIAMQLAWRDKQIEQLRRDVQAMGVALEHAISLARDREQQIASLRDDLQTQSAEHASKVARLAAEHRKERADLWEMGWAANDCGRMRSENPYREQPSKEPSDA